MGKLRIDSLIASGPKGRTELSFGPRLTIIAGPSDTGKSYIFKSVDFLFGSKDSPWDPMIGYDRLQMKLSTESGSVDLTRKIGDSYVDVTSEIPGIASGTYSYKKLNPVFMTMLDLPADLKVPKNENGETISFTWRSFKEMLMVHENWTETEKSIILPKSTFIPPTSFYSELLYMLFDQDFSEYDAEENKKTKAIRKAAVQKYILTQKEQLEKTKIGLETSLKSIKDSNLEEAINNLSNQLVETEDAITKTFSDNQQIAQETIKVQDKLHEQQALMSRYKILETQYQSDIKRLGAIVEGEALLKERPNASKCPFCHSEIHIPVSESYLTAAKAELKKTVVNINDLSFSMDDLTVQIENLSETLRDLNGKKEKIDKYVNETLLPKKQELEKRLDDYQKLTSINSQLEIVKSMSVGFDGDLKEIDQKIVQKTDFKPKELFPSDFAETIAKNYLAIMKECNYSPCNNASFDMTNFDIVINGQAKATHGKGYRAFFNSLLILAFRQYLNEHAQHNPHFYFIDSPLHGLSIADEENSEENVRLGFFNYLVNHQNDDQVIVIENTDKHDLPSIDYEQKGVKLIKYSQSPNAGKYGFLDGIQK
jgi:hypothetical protein